MMIPKISNRSLQVILLSFFFVYGTVQGYSEEILSGSERANMLMILNKQDSHSWPTDGKETQLEIRYIGTIAEISVYETLLVWGSAGRATWRLVFLGKNSKYIGQYSHFNPSRIDIIGTRLVFSEIQKEDGNSIDLLKGIPKKVRIDGQIIEFYK